MPPTEIQAEVEAQEAKETTSSKPVVGIIYPPPEVRNIVDKTASFVARNGPEFETRIRQNELNNPKFNFLNPSDPYHAYYQHKVKEFQEGKGREPVAPKASLLQRPPGPTMGVPSEQTKTMQSQLMTAAEPVLPKEPPPEPEFIADPPSISAFELDVVRLTAQFVARNGRQFVTSLITQQQRNYQFDFLRPQHGLFNYFTRLVEQYTKILIPPKDLLPKLQDDARDMNSVLNKVKARVEWARFQEREKQKEEEAKEKERVAYAQIDWHDFVVVETVDFQPNEQGNLPPPTTPDEVGARVLAQERFETAPVESEMVEMEVESSDEEDDDEDEEEEDEEDEVQRSRTESRAVRKQPTSSQVQDMEEESDSDEETAPQSDKPPLPPSLPPLPPRMPVDAPQPPPLPPVPDQVLVRKDYDPKALKSDATPASDQYLISPITGEKIAADKIQEHMRIGLLDRKWTDQRDRAIASKRDQEEVYAAGSAIDSSLKQLAERRTDIFGYGVEERKIGEKLGEDELQQREKVTWDGHTASMEKVTQKARENISIEDQIAVIHKAKGLVQDEEKERIGPARPLLTAPLPTPPLPPPSQPPAPPKQPPAPAAPPSAAAPPARQVVAPPAVPTRPLLPRPPPMALPMPPRPPPPSNMMMMPPMMPPNTRMRQPMMGMPPGPPMPMPTGYGLPRMPVGMPPPPPASLPPPIPAAQPPPPPGHKPVGMDDGEPASKRARTEDSLLPENIFLQTHTSPVTFRVLVPSIPDKPEWKLNGQTVTLSLPLTDNISVIKAKLNEALGMPAGKQKLQYDGMFVKDSNTLAFYNFTRDTTVQLQLKERGGRKK